ncbi:hypothetical protein AVEN_105428-1 [Araneus ventricosus]|uniref:Uncharacterized protein n=1 Tax=Araneus ventricosus TaxID=182803 RepID=A0A4Y2IEZ5_ARAVE|nr:hypothetical protein AVEN_105428-1 [Araneus ventricosus]
MEKYSGKELMEKYSGKELMEKYSGKELMEYSSILKVLLLHYMKHSNHGMEIEACPLWKEEKKMVRQPYEDGVRKLNVIIAAFQNSGLKEPENF